MIAINVSETHFRFVRLLLHVVRSHKTLWHCKIDKCVYFVYNFLNESQMIWRVEHLPDNMAVIDKISFEQL